MPKRPTAKKRAPVLGLNPLLFSKIDAAKILGVCPKTVELLYYQRQLRGVRIGKRVLFHRDALAEFARCGAASVRGRSYSSPVVSEPAAQAIELS